MICFYYERGWDYGNGHKDVWESKMWCSSDGDRGGNLDDGKGGGDRIGDALRALKEALLKDKKCENFLNGKLPKDGTGTAAVPYIDQLLQYKAYGQIAEKGTVQDGTLSIVNGWEGGRVVGQSITVNSLGAFFNSVYRSDDGKEFSLSTNNGRIAGGTSGAQGFILLHELAHATKAIQPDSQDYNQGLKNNDALNKNCKTTISILSKKK